MTTFNHRFKKTISFEKDKTHDLKNECNDRFARHCHRIGGYPLFTQDNLKKKLKYAEYELLFQLDTDYGDEVDITWGNMGVGGFFIRPDDLKKCNFTNIMYN